jgi:hypothetical protein
MLGGETAEVTTMERVARGRGEVQKHVRLSPESKTEVVRRFHAGTLQRELAQIYGVHRTTIAAIIRQHAGTTLRCGSLKSHSRGHDNMDHLGGVNCGAG